MQNDTLVAVDIAKEVFEVGVSDRPGRVVKRLRLDRRLWLLREELQELVARL
jgi:hypothetical protein